MLRVGIEVRSQGVGSTHRPRAQGPRAAPERTRAGKRFADKKKPPARRRGVSPCVTTSDYWQRTLMAFRAMVIVCGVAFGPLTVSITSTGTCAGAVSLQLNVCWIV